MLQILLATRRSSARSKSTSHITSAPDGYRSVALFLQESPRLLLALHLAGLFLLLCVLRWHLFDLPLERDEGAYAYIGQCALNGQAPYRDFYEFKPPLLFYVYALLIKIFGYSAEGLRWMSFFLGAVNAFLIYAIGTKLYRSAMGFWAGVFYLLWSSNPYLSAIVAEAELVLMVFSLGGYYLLAAYLRQQNMAGWRDAARFLIPAGALLSAGVLVKQSGVFLALTAGLSLIIAGWYQRHSIRKIGTEAGLMLAGALIPALLCAVLISAFGVWEECWFWNVTAPGQYVSSITTDMAYQLFGQVFRILFRGYEGLWLLAGGGLTALLMRGIASAPVRWLLFLFALGGLAAIFPGRRFYGHYWLQLIPALALLAGYAVAVLAHVVKVRFAGLVANVVSSGIVLTLVVITLVTNYDYWHPASVNVLIEKMYNGNYFSGVKHISIFLKKNMRPQDQLMVLGSEPQLYVYLNRQAPTRHFYCAHLTNNRPQTPAWQEEALQALQNKSPEYVVFCSIPYSWSLQKGDSDYFIKKSFEWSFMHYEAVYWLVYPPNAPPNVMSGENARLYKPSGRDQYHVVLRRKRN